MTTEMVTLAEVKEELNDILHRVAHHKERLIVMRRDKPVAAIIPLEDLWVLENSQNTNDLQEATESLKEGRQQGFINLDEFIAERINSRDDTLSH